MQAGIFAVQIVATDISRRFGNTLALSGVSLTLASGAIHALVGENGAGKSTLLKILGGAEHPDAGAITVDGAPFAPRSLAEAVRRGVGLVFQEVTINPSLSVAENIFAGQLRRFRRAGLLMQGRLMRDAQAILDSFAADVSVRRSLSSLDLGQWKCIEIARALSTAPRAIFFDESTAFLNHREVDVVLAAMRALRDKGIAVAFVSHHLAEVGAVADRLTILKDGRKVGDYAAGELDRDGIQTRMVGRDMSQGMYPARTEALEGATILRLAAVASSTRLRPLDLDLRRGEVLGVAGLKGAGGERLLEIVAGVVQPDAGTMQLDGKRYAATNPAQAWHAGIAYLPGDRTTEGLIVDASVLDNVVMARQPHRGPFFDGRRARQLAGGLMKRLHIKAESVKAPVRSLSGGNLQKVVLGKCLAPAPRVLLLNNPTRGVDVGARAEIYRSLRQAAAEGLAILMVSEDLNELLGLSDRILVLRGGTIAARFDDPATATEDAIIRHMT